MSKLAHSNQETMDAIERAADDLPEPPSWWCDPCKVEVYARTCPHCGKTERQKRAFYFGCGLHGLGHYFHDEGVKRRLYSWDAPEPSFPKSWMRLYDGGLLRNGNVPDQPDGRVHWTCGAPLWCAFFWWDRSGDSRPGSNSGFYVAGFGLRDEIAAFVYACEKFPQIVARQKYPLGLAR